MEKNKKNEILLIERFRCLKGMLSQLRRKSNLLLYFNDLNVSHVEAFYHERKQFHSDD